ncbi:MAG: methyltransferase domain-containing protein [Actinomycetota bacterium]|jgi:SAM-dependent methyltransferase
MSGLVLRSHDGRALPLDAHRWHDEATPAERALLALLSGPVLDVGCGPGRLVVGLARRGTVALGIDPAPGAVEIARRRGAPVLQRSVFDVVPGQGRWRTVLLVDGNIGIGGDPVRLLQRCRALCAPAGTIVAEVEPPGVGFARHRARLERGATHGPWFPWAVVGVDALAGVAAPAGLRVRRVVHVEDEQRWFAHLIAGDGSSDRAAA